MPALLFCASWEMGFSGLGKVEALHEAPGLTLQHCIKLRVVARACNPMIDTWDAKAWGSESGSSVGV